MKLQAMLQTTYGCPCVRTGLSCIVLKTSIWCFLYSIEDQHSVLRMSHTYAEKSFDACIEMDFFSCKMTMRVLAPGWLYSRNSHIKIMYSKANASVLVLTRTHGCTTSIRCRQALTCDPTADLRVRRVRPHSRSSDPVRFDCLWLQF